MIAVDSPTSTKSLEEPFIDAFNATRQEGGSPDALYEVRRRGYESFVEMGFPSSRDESWKYTNVGKVLALPHEISVIAAIDDVEERDVAPFLVDGLESDTVVLLDGRIVPHLTRVSGKGAYISGLREAVRNESVLAHIGRYATDESNSFIALNTAFASDGLVIHATRGMQAPAPIHVVNLVSGSERFVQPRILVIVEPEANLTVIESQHVLGNGRAFVNSVSEAYVGEQARLDYHRLQDGGRAFSAVTNANFYQERTSYASCSTVTLSGNMIRNNVVMHPDGEHCESHLFGLFVGQDDLHIDNHTLVDHARPNCFSNELYKGVLDGTSTGVFNGRVLVRRDAQQTNAYQSNKSIVLSDGASMNAKPELEIYADDVKCSHGATTGRLDEEAMFYLRSRGLSKGKARTMLLLAFVRDVIENIRPDALKEHLDAILQHRLASKD